MSRKKTRVSKKTPVNHRRYLKQLKSKGELHLDGIGEAIPKTLELALRLATECNAEIHSSTSTLETIQELELEDPEQDTLVQTKLKSAIHLHLKITSS